MRAIATSVETTIATLEARFAAASLTTDCTPDTSLVRRLWISPVRVSEKKRIGIDCTCVKRRLRKSRITNWPTDAVSHD